jgi:hypothetical protein
MRCVRRHWSVATIVMANPTKIIPATAYSHRKTGNEPPTTATARRQMPTNV